MHSDLYERCHALRQSIDVPPFPVHVIRHAMEKKPRAGIRRRTMAAALAATISLAAIAAAAEFVQQTHVRFTPSGGMVISSDAKSGSRTISSDGEIRQAAQHLSFHAILPAGLPPGSKPIRLFTSGTDMLAITYDLPGAQRRSHHFLWVFLTDPKSLSNAPPARRYRLRTGDKMSQAHWRVGAEEVIVVSNGLTAQELSAMKRAMQRTQ
jgi:hypothetical protein